MRQRSEATAFKTLAFSLAFGYISAGELRAATAFAQNP
jgi:hypothetical protein